MNNYYLPNGCLAIDSPAECRAADLKCKDCQDRQEIQDQLAEPMLWIGLYVAAASLLCTLAMAADVFQGFRHRKLWFPCKYFTLNATSLTLLAIATKLPVDLSGLMEGEFDQLAKISSIAFMYTVMGNFITSLAPMDNKDMFMNVVALGILIITIVVNLCIQIGTGAIGGFLFILPNTVVMVCMLGYLALMSFSALIVPTIKKDLEVKYREMQKINIDEEPENRGSVKVEKLKATLRKYWMMAETSSLQFVMARSAICSASGATCFLFLIVALVVLVFAALVLAHEMQHPSHSGPPTSDYKWSTKLILVIQTFGVVVGAIAPVFRWFTVLRFKYSMKKRDNCRHIFKVENYWIRGLVEWKESPLPLEIRSRKCRKLVQHTKSLILNICIVLQVVIVVASKLFILVTYFFLFPLLSCIYHCNQLKKRHISNPQTEAGTGIEFSPYVLLLEGEEDIPQSTLIKISNAADRMIDMGKKQQPKNLMKLLERSISFNGVAEFDRSQVESLHSEEAPKCWSLVVATLTSIAIALPNIRDDVAEQLVCSVNEGLSYTKIIDKSLDTDGTLLNTRKAADVVWSGVELSSRWLDKDLRELSCRGTTTVANLKELADLAQRNLDGGAEANPLNWPVKVIASNSMYRTSHTIMLHYQNRGDKSSEALFKKLSVMIADILGACLTNLPCVINMKCFRSAIEKREESVQQAARLLGETEAILGILQERELPPGLDPKKMATIDEWCTLLKQVTSSTVLSSSNEGTVSGSGEVLVTVPQDPSA